MSYLVDLINSISPDTKDYYDFLNNVHDGLVGITAASNPAITLNSDFSTLSAQGTTPTTPADGNNFQFINDWKVFGSTAANYTITATPYPNNSLIQSASTYYVHLTTSSFNGNPFYFYQRQTHTVRKYQKNNLSFDTWIQNNQSVAIKVLVSAYSYYDTANNLANATPIYLQPGINKISSTLLTQSLSGVTVGASPYTDFRLNFLELSEDGSCDLDIYLIKGEMGTLSTPLY